MPEFKNIVGSAFPEYVKTQIEKRKDLVKSPTRNSKELSWLSNRTGWFRMTSGAKIQGSDSLARNNVLQGGSVKTQDGSQTTLKQGFNETYVNQYNDDLGYRPMPGITNLSVGTGGKWQTILQADVEFIAYNLDQLDVLSKLYMSLGVHVFIEWGHIPYLDNNGNLERNQSPIDFFNYEGKPLNIPFIAPPGRVQLLRAISQKKKNTGGNYEALLGRVYNFNYNSNPDGTYTCKIQVMGPGAMAESLRINKATGYGFSSNPTDIDTSYTSDLENALYSIKEHLERGKYSITRSSSNSGEKKTKGNLGVVSYDNGNFFEVKRWQDTVTFAEARQRGDSNIPPGGGSKMYPTEESYADLLNRIYNKCNYKGPQFIEGQNILFSDDIAKYGNAHQLISNIGDFSNFDNLSPIPTSLFNGYAAKTQDSWWYDWNGAPADLTYITLGHLMCLIQHMGVFVENPGKPLPAVYLDYHPDNTIIKTAPLQASVDPSICMVPLKLQGKGVDKIIFSKFFGSLSVSKAVIYLYEEGRKEPINTNDKTNLIVNKDKNAINKSLENIKGTEFDGKIFNILVNINYAIDCIKNIANSKSNKEVYMLEYINKILDGINISLGKINNFRANYVDCAHVIRIVDENIVETIPDEKILELPVFGLNSVAYDYSYSSKLSPNTSAQIVIAAQAQDAGGVKNFPEEALTYNHLNGGVIDRFTETLTPPLESTIDKDDSDITVTRGYQKLYEHITQIYSLDIDKNTPPQSSKNLSILFDDLQNLNLKYDAERNATIILPLEFSVTLDGISGILPYNAFTIPDNRLPARYRGRVMFAVFSINHTFESNQWKTQLKGLTILKGKSAPEDNRTLSEEDKNAKPLPPAPSLPSSSTNYGGTTTPQFSLTTEIPQPDPKGEPLPSDIVDDSPIVEPPLDARPNPISIPPNDVIGAMELIRTHEPRTPGVPELTAYKDRDYTNNSGFTYRIGYGSDTITTTTGIVRKVKKGDRITKAEAEADLRRRVDSIRNTIIQRCNSRGLDYNSISDFRVQIVFIDCAYNYGTLWYDIIDSFKNGGKAGLIAELKARIARGSSQVPSRRQAEINYLQG